MLPYLQLWSTKLSVFWLGVVVSIIVFIYSAWQYCKKNQLDFFPFFFSIPWIFLIIYFFWKLFGYLMESQMPLWKSTITYIISPNWSEFHYVGLVIGWFMSMILFFFNKTKNNIKNIIDMIFFSSMWSIITMWMFLVFSDYVIWKPNDHGWFAIRALSSYSKISQYWQVYPYGLIISGIGIFSYLITRRLGIITNRTWIWYIWFAIFFLSMNYWFWYQLYIRHGVSLVFGMNLDIKHYINLILSILCISQYYRLNIHNSNK